MVRDFSDEQKRILLEMVKEVQPDNIFAKVIDFFDDVFHRAIIKVNINDYLSDINNYHKKMIDYDNVSAQKIIKIFDDVAQVDAHYKNEIQNSNQGLEKLIVYVRKCSNAISYRSAQLTSQSSVNTTNPSPSPSSNTGTYVVRKGDTLTAIAQRYNTTVAELVRLNNIKNPDLIITGQTLILPVLKIGKEVVNGPYHTGRNHPLPNIIVDSIVNAVNNVVNGNTFVVNDGIITINGVAFTDYPVNSKFTDNNDKYLVRGEYKYLGAWQCFGFARYSQEMLYHCNSFSNPKQFQKVVGDNYNISHSELSVEKLKECIITGGVGSHIRTGVSSKTGNQHSMIIASIENDGFTVVHGNADGKGTVLYKKYTWEEYINSDYGYRGIDYIEKYIG